MATIAATEGERSSSISVFELKGVPRDPLRTSGEGRKAGEKLGTDTIEGDNEAPDTAFEALPKWNESRINVWKVLATFFSFFIFGMNDGALGVRNSIPVDHLQSLTICRH
jgi:hypothetical protein